MAHTNVYVGSVCAFLSGLVNSMADLTFQQWMSAIGVIGGLVFAWLNYRLQKRRLERE